MPRPLEMVLSMAQVLFIHVSTLVLKQHTDTLMVTQTKLSFVSRIVSGRILRSHVSVSINPSNPTDVADGL